MTYSKSIVTEHILGCSAVFSFLEVFVELVLSVGIVVGEKEVIDDEDGDAECGKDD